VTLTGSDAGKLFETLFERALELAFARLLAIALGLLVELVLDVLSRNSHCNLSLQAARGERLTSNALGHDDVPVSGVRHSVMAGSC
jgi:hypothetical protein